MLTDGRGEWGGRSDGGAEEKVKGDCFDDDDGEFADPLLMSQDRGKRGAQQKQHSRYLPSKSARRNMPRFEAESALRTASLMKDDEMRLSPTKASRERHGAETKRRELKVADSDDDDDLDILNMASDSDSSGSDDDIAPVCRTRQMNARRRNRSSTPTSSTEAKQSDAAAETPGPKSAVETAEEYYAETNNGDAASNKPSAHFTEKTEGSPNTASSRTKSTRVDRSADEASLVNAKDAPSLEHRSSPKHTFPAHVHRHYQAALDSSKVAQCEVKRFKKGKVFQLYDGSDGKLFASAKRMRKGSYTMLDNQGRVIGEIRPVDKKGMSTFLLLGHDAGGVDIELLAVSYSLQMSGYGALGPGEISVAIPGISDDGWILAWPCEKGESLKDFVYAGDSSTLMCRRSRYENAAARSSKHVRLLQNETPKESETHFGTYEIEYALDRHPLRSIKNFVLRARGAGKGKPKRSALGGTAIQFGRINKESFFLDFAPPLSPLQAFTLAICSTVSSPSSSSKPDTIGDLERAAAKNADENKEAWSDMDANKRYTPKSRATFMPVEASGVSQLRIQWTKGTYMRGAQFRAYDAETSTFVFGTQKTKFGTTAAAKYVWSKRETLKVSNDGDVAGRLRAETKSAPYVLVDSGVKYAGKDEDGFHEIGAVYFEGTASSRRCTIAIPRPNVGGQQPSVWNRRREALSLACIAEDPHEDNGKESYLRCKLRTSDLDIRWKNGKFALPPRFPDSRCGARPPLEISLRNSSSGGSSTSEFDVSVRFPLSRAQAFGIFVAFADSGYISQQR